MVSKSPSLSTCLATLRPFTSTPLVLFEILDDDLARALEEHGVMAADRLRVDLQLTPRRAADPRAPAQGVGGPGVALDLDQLGEELSRERRRRRGGAQPLDAGLQAAEHVGVVVGAALQPPDVELALLQCPPGALERGSQRAILLGELVDAEVFNASSSFSRLMSA